MSSEPLALKTYCDGNDLTPLVDRVKRTSPTHLILDATGMTSLTSACLQIMLSTDQTCRAKGGHVTLVNISTELQESLSLMGVEPQRFLAEGLE